MLFRRKKIKSNSEPLFPRSESFQQLLSEVVRTMAKNDELVGEAAMVYLELLLHIQEEGETPVPDLTHFANQLSLQPELFIQTFNRLVERGAIELRAQSINGQLMLCYQIPAVQTRRKQSNRTALLQRTEWIDE